VTYEWDEPKRRENLRKHRVDFEFAVEAFDDPWLVEPLDDRHPYGETRWRAVGEVDGVLLLVVYTERLDAIRIISARKANRFEREDYETHRFA